VEHGPPFPPLRIPERVFAVAYNQHGALISAANVASNIEVNRLCTCNLRRDDQCLSEGRFPYVDEDGMA
jgi:hypothetical protein